MYHSSSSEKRFQVGLQNFRIQIDAKIISALVVSEQKVVRRGNQIICMSQHMDYTIIYSLQNF